MLAAALAAVTAAFVGSRLGVYGTVIGAGIISLATTVGGEIYLRSLERTKVAALRTKDAAVARAVRTGAAWPAARTASTSTRADDADDADDADGAETAEVPTPEPEGGVDTVGPEPEPRRGVRWPMLIAGAVAAFVLGMGAVTGIEAITGNSLSGEQGGTVSNVLGGRSAQDSDQQEQPAGEQEDDEAPKSTSSEPPSTPPSTPASGEPEPSKPSQPSETTEPPESTGPSKPPASTTEPEPEPSGLPELPPRD